MLATRGGGGCEAMHGSLGLARSLNEGDLRAFFRTTADFRPLEDRLKVGVRGSDLVESIEYEEPLADCFHVDLFSDEQFMALRRLTVLIKAFLQAEAQLAVGSFSGVTRRQLTQLPSPALQEPLVQEAPLPREVRDAFRRFDRSCSGFISFSELQQALAHLGVTRSNSDVMRVLNQIHPGGVSGVDVRVFHNLLLVLSAASSRNVTEEKAIPQAVQDVFTFFDEKHVGLMAPDRVAEATSILDLDTCSARAERTLRDHALQSRHGLDLVQFNNLVQSLQDKASVAASSSPAAMPPPDSEVPSQLRAVFEAFACTSADFLSAGELYNALCCLGVHATNEDVLAIIHHYESEPGSKVDLQEFHRLVSDLAHATGAPTLLGGV